MKPFIKTNLVLLVLILTSTLTGCAAEPEKTMEKRPQALINKDQTYIENQYIFHLAEDEGVESMIQKDFNRFGIVAFKKVKHRWVLIELNRDPGIDAILEYCRGLPYIQSVQRNQIYRQHRKNPPPGSKIR